MCGVGACVYFTSITIILLYSWARVNNFRDSYSLRDLLFYSTLLICLHTVKWFQVLLYNTNN